MIYLNVQNERIQPLPVRVAEENHLGVEELVCPAPAVFRYSTSPPIRLFCCSGHRMGSGAVHCGACVPTSSDLFSARH
ncbi:hypothetical protein J6590_016661 [Homalodisca vitripennis]|nr:hypothetical protein J6590_016661 [Homalodisca vitripennis]